MALDPRDEVEFDEDDLSPIEAVLADLQGHRRGWVNFVPEVEDGHDPGPRSMVAAIFSARGDAIPHATWKAAETEDGRSTLGIEHGSGPRALDRLVDRQLGLAQGWMKVADHPRRGLVVSAHREVPLADQLWWLLASSHALSTVPLTGAWLAKVY